MEKHGTANECVKKYICALYRPVMLPFVDVWAQVFDNTESYIALFTGLLFLSTVALWWSTQQLWKSGEAATKLANRAWVFAEPCEQTAIFTGGSHVSFRIKIANNGRTPARVTKVEVCFGPGEPETDSSEATFRNLIDKQFIIGGGESFLYPDPFDTDMQNRYIFGSIFYTDAFGHHESRFCRRLDNTHLVPSGSSYWNSF